VRNHRILRTYMYQVSRWSAISTKRFWSDGQWLWYFQWSGWSIAFSKPIKNYSSVLGLHLWNCSGIILRGLGQTLMLEIIYRTPWSSLSQLCCWHWSSPQWRLMCWHVLNS
jgi:hypothetical protein